MPPDSNSLVEDSHDIVGVDGSVDSSRSVGSVTARRVAGRTHRPSPIERHGLAPDLLTLEAHDDVIVTSTIDLGHDLGLRVVAEGIENNEVMDRFVEVGCDIGQGYGISRPLEVEKFDTWLATTSHCVPRIEHDPSCN